MRRSQCDIIVDYLKAGNSLTPMECYEKFKITTLSQRCGEVNRNPKRYGIEIDSVTVHENGSHFSRYFEKFKSELF